TSNPIELAYKVGCRERDRYARPLRLRQTPAHNFPADHRTYKCQVLLVCRALVESVFKFANNSSGALSMFGLLACRAGVPGEDCTGGSRINCEVLSPVS